MVVQLRKPILVTGVGLSFLLWIGSVIEDSIMGLGEWGLPGAIALGTGLWWWRKQRQQPNPSVSLVQPEIDQKAVESAIAQAQTVLDKLTTEAPETEVSGLQHRLNQLWENLDRETLNIAITGGKNVGKTRLKEALTLSSGHLIETPALYQNNSDHDTIEATALPCEIVIFVVNGDLTDSEYQTIQQWRQLQQKILLVFNKQDHYSPEQQALIRKQLQTRLSAILPETDLLSTTAHPAPIKVRKFQADNSHQEWQETPPAEIEALETRLNTLLNQEKQTLLYQSTWRQAYLLKQEAKTILNRIRRQRALPYIEQYQWVAAGTAFANPVSSLDLLATAAINTQLVIDLGKIYQQKFSWQQAQTVAGTIGKQMVKLGLVEFSTQTMTSLLKTNTLTYFAGGTVQGLSAAYLTRIAGLSLIEYFQEQEISQTTGEELNLNRLGEKLQEVFQNNQRTALLKSLLQQGKERLFKKEQLPVSSEQ
jgi:uncharacterized protein (DUF697 family)/GTP-binding protein EngB required for normal cell division